MKFFGLLLLISAAAAVSVEIQRKQEYSAFGSSFSGFKSCYQDDLDRNDVSFCEKYGSTKSSCEANGEMNFPHFRPCSWNSDCSNTLPECEKDSKSSSCQEASRACCKAGDSCRADFEALPARNSTISPSPSPSTSTTPAPVYTTALFAPEASPVDLIDPPAAKDKNVTDEKAAASPEDIVAVHKDHKKTTSSTKHKSKHKKTAAKEEKQATKKSADKTSKKTADKPAVVAAASPKPKEESEWAKKKKAAAWFKAVADKKGSAGAKKESVAAKEESVAVKEESVAAVALKQKVAAHSAHKKAEDPAFVKGEIFTASGRVFGVKVAKALPSIAPVEVTLPKNTTKKVFTASDRPNSAHKLAANLVHKRASATASASPSSSSAPMIFTASDRERTTVKKSVAKKSEAKKSEAKKVQPKK